ncbi:MAG TPA: vitamin K epoxide reductase family protein [Phycisphaerae bacterium]|nr:vitamin K epoxide reductase family protein [Phycisphaerae bacterium]
MVPAPNSPIHQRGRKIAEAVVWASLALAWAASLVLWWGHKALAADGSLGLRICSSGSDCATVLRSPRAILWGVPLAGWGMLYFSALAGWLAFRGLPAGRRRRDLATVAWVVLGAVVSGCCLHWMGKIAGAFCPWCCATHALNFLLAAVVVACWLGRDAPRPRLRWGLAAPAGAARPSWR